MSTLHSAFLQTLTQRGFVHQCTDSAALDDAANAGPVTAYVGYDCTAPSLHIGNLVSIMMLRHLQRTGHRPIVLMGGGTTRVGDPSGKDEQRSLLSEQRINANMANIRRVFARFLRFGDGPDEAIMVNNADWLDELAYIPFLRDFGRHFSVNRMLSFDSVRLRLDREQPLSFLEFNYMVLQAYDFVELNRRHGCRLQMGGSDQWGNIVNGVELGRRVDGAQMFGLTCPLITTASGQKMGKTHQGAVWLDGEMLSPFEYWQFWRNTEDADVGRFLRLFTDMPEAEIGKLAALEGAEINDAKIALATAATALCHGEDTARAAEETARKTFAEGALGDALRTETVSRDELRRGLGVLDAFCRVGLTKSNGEARRLIRGGGARINDAPVDDDSRTIAEADLNADGLIKLSAGKKRHAVIKPT